MSFTATLDPPIDPTTPEGKEYLRAKQRGFWMAPAAALPAAAAAIPAAPTGIYSFLGGTIPDAVNWASGKLGYNLNIPHAPGVETATKVTQAIEDTAQKLIPTDKLITPENKDEQMLWDTYAALGSVLPAPEIVSSKLPAIANLVAPPAKAWGPVAAANAAVTGGVEDYIDHQQPAPQLVELDEQGNPIRAEGARSDTQARSVSQPQSDQSQQSQTQPQPQQGEGPSLGQIAAGTAIALPLAWLGMKYGPRTLNKLVDTLHGVSTDPAAVSQLIDDVKAGRNPPTTVRGTEPLEMPLPSEAPGTYGPTTRLAQRWINQNAVLNEVAKGITSNTDEAEALIGHNNMTNYPAGQTRRMESQFRTGVSPTGYVGPSQYDAKIMVDSMTDGERQLANQAAWFRSELDNRTANNGQRVWFPQYDDATLQHVVAQAQSNPLTKAYLDHVSATGQFIPDDMARLGYITPQQAAQAKRLNPNFMPTFDVEGNLRHSWTGRDLSQGSGFLEPPMPAWEAQAAYYSRMYSQAHNNAFVRDWLERLANFSRANPEYRNLVVETAEPNRLGTGMTVQSATGPKHYDVNSTVLRDSLRNNAQMSMGLAAANYARRAYQSNITGVPAALLGNSVFAVKNLIRDVLQIPNQARPGTYTGLISRAAGGKLPFYDPTFISGSIGTAGRDAGAVIAKTLSDALTSSDHPLSKILGPQRSAALRDWLHQRYLNSRLEARVGEGIGGGGGFGTYEPTTRLAGQTAMREGLIHDPLGSQVAPLVARPKLENVADKVPLGKGAVVSYLNLRELLRELHGVVSDAPHSYLYDLNRDNPKFMQGGRLDTRKLGNEVQQVIGDPSTHGSGKIARGVFGSLPFANVSTQALASAARSFREHPISFGLRTASTVALLSLASQLSALVSGPKHTEHLENKVANATKEANAIIYHGPGTDPNVHTELSLPQEQRAIKPIFDAATSAALGTWRAHENEPLRERIIHTLAELFHHHVSPDVMKQSQLGTADFVAYPLQLSPLGAGAVAAMSGQSPGNIAQTMVQNVQEGRPITQGVMTSSDNKSLIPGQEATSNYMAANDSKYFRALMSTLLGTSGQSLADLISSGTARWDQTHDWGWVLHGLQSDIKQNAMEQNKWGNVIWQGTMPLSTRNPADIRTSTAMDNIRETIKGAGDIKNLGFTRSGGQQTLVVGNTPVPTDPTMKRVYLTMGQFGQAMNSKLMPQINDLYKQMQITRDSAYTADEKRRILNNYAEQLSAKRRQLDGELEKLNHTLSTITGRHVDVTKRIDWRGGVDQFPEN